MAVNKESNGYTFLFAIILVVVVGAGLAGLSEGLKPIQLKNQADKKKIEILSAIKVESTRKEANDKFEQYITEQLVLDSEGEVQEGEIAFDLDVQSQFRDKTIDPKDRKYPLYIAENEGKKYFIIPMVGKGLWGPIWGFVAIEDDKASIYGATFNHKGETPGLGAEIATPAFQSQFDEGVVIQDGGSFKEIAVQKPGKGKPNSVDGITGGTITSKGVEEMLNRTLQVYVKYFNKSK